MLKIMRHNVAIVKSAARQKGPVPCGSGPGFLRRLALVALDYGSRSNVLSFSAATRPQPAKLRRQCPCLPGIAERRHDAPAREIDQGLTVSGAGRDRASRRAVEVAEGPGDPARNLQVRAIFKDDTEAATAPDQRPRKARCGAEL